MYLLFPRLHLRVHLLALPALLVTVWLEGWLPACLLLSAATLHECGHLLAVRCAGAPIRRIDIEPMGGLIVYDDSLCSLRACVCIALAGALVNLLCGTVATAFLLLGSKSAHLLYFAVCNLLLAFLNLLPWEKLDGGKVLFLLLLAKREPAEAERICAAVSSISLLCVLVLLAFAGMHAAFPLWSVLLSAVLLSRALL